MDCVRSVLVLALVVISATFVTTRFVIETPAEAARSARDERGRPTESTASLSINAGHVGQLQRVVAITIDQPRSSSAERWLPSVALRARLSTRPGDLLDSVTLEADRQALEDELVARGYRAAKVLPASVTFTPTGAYVLFDLERGPMFHVRRVEVVGELADTVLAAGDDAIASRFERARAALEGGRRAGTVKLITHDDVPSASVDVTLVVGR